MNSVAIAPPASAPPAAATVLGWLGGTLRRHPTAIAGGVVLVVMVAIAILAPWLGTMDPLSVVPTRRLKPPSAQFWFGGVPLPQLLWVVPVTSWSATT